MKNINSFNSERIIEINDQNFKYFDLNKAAEFFDVDLSKIPISIKIIIENLLRNEDGENINKEMNSLLRDGIIISKFNDQSTLKSLENLQKELKVYEELKSFDQNSKSSKVSLDKSFLKIITNYYTCSQKEAKEQNYGYAFLDVVKLSHFPLFDF